METPVCSLVALSFILSGVHCSFLSFFPHTKILLTKITTNRTNKNKNWRAFFFSTTCTLYTPSLSLSALTVRFVAPCQTFMLMKVPQFGRWETERASDRQRERERVSLQAKGKELMINRQVVVSALPGEVSLITYLQVFVPKLDYSANSSLHTEELRYREL